MKPKFLLFLMLSLFITVSCSKDDKVHIEFDNKTFDKEHTEWLKTNYQNYKFDIEYNSLDIGARKETIIVRDGVSSKFDWYLRPITEIYSLLKHTMNLCLVI